jgi:hypothetical protein
MSECTRDLHIRLNLLLAAMSLLEKAIEGAPLGDPSDKEMAEIYVGIKARRKKNSQQTNISLNDQNIHLLKCSLSFLRCSREAVES